MRRALSKGEMICGLDGLEARRILKRFGDEGLSLEQGARQCELDESSTRAVFEQFVSEGYLKEIKVPRENWSLTDKARRLFDKSTKRVLKRCKAEEKLQGLVTRVKELNKDAYYLYRVSRLGVFGSYLTDKNLLGDVDVCVSLEARQTDQSRHMELHKGRIKRAFVEGQRFSNFSDEVLYPITECFRFLKGRSAKLNFTPYSSIEALGCPIDWIYVSSGKDFVVSKYNPDILKPYLCSAGISVGFVAIKACEIGKDKFSKGDKIDLRTKRPWSVDWGARPRPTDEWVSISEGFPPQMLSSAELIELAEALSVDRRVVYHCRGREAEEYMKREACKGCGTRSWRMNSIDYPILFCNGCSEMVAFYWKAPRVVRN